jgi:hypothetical protein
MGEADGQRRHDKSPQAGQTQLCASHAASLSPFAVR